MSGWCNKPLEDEVKNVLFSFRKGKAPRPDRFTAEFFQKFWHELKATVMGCASVFFP